MNSLYYCTASMNVKHLNLKLNLVISSASQKNLSTKVQYNRNMKLQVKLKIDVKIANLQIEIMIKIGILRHFSRHLLAHSIKHNLTFKSNYDAIISIAK